MKKKNQLLKVFVAIALGIVFGLWAGKERYLYHVHLYSLFDVLGSLFINALTLVVVPLVVSSIISGVAKIGGEDDFKRLGAKTFSLFIVTTLGAVAMGVVFVNLINPGLLRGKALFVDAMVRGPTLDPLPVQGEGAGLVSVLMKIVPPNLFEALSTVNMLGLIFFSILFGYALSRIPEHPRQTLHSFFQGVFQTMIHMTHLIIYFLPYGVFFLVAKAFSSTSQGFSAIGFFAVTVLSGFVVFALVGLPFLIRFLGKVSPRRFFKGMMPALVTAFSTSSSSATLPVTLDCIEKKIKVSNRIASLVLPLGSSMNMAGSALFNVVVTLFMVQAYGLNMSLQTQGTAALLAFVTSFGLASVPSGGLVTLLIILKTMGVPADGIGLVVAIDRILDMFRTTVNVMTSSSCTLLVARLEGEKTDLATDK